MYFVGQPKFNYDPKNHVKRCQNWDDAVSMNEDLISYWNDTIPEDGIVFVLGEFQDLTNRNMPGYTYKDLVTRLNGRLCHVYHRKDGGAAPLYDTVEHFKTDYTEICVLDTMIQYDHKTIHITNFLEHINRIESNLVITSCGRYLSKENTKSIYFSMHGSTIFQNNIINPVYNVNLDVWDYKPVSISEILSRYSLYLKHNEE